MTGVQTCALPILKMAIKKIEKCKSRHLSTVDMEIAVSGFLDARSNLIVPGIHWGMEMHECDLLIISKAGYAKEVEIKISKQDLVKDKNKLHGHQDCRIKELWFAIPKFLEPHIELVPERAGIILVNGGCRCEVLRGAEIKKPGYKFSDAEKLQVARLGSLRIWGLKRKIRKLEARLK